MRASLQTLTFRSKIRLSKGCRSAAVSSVLLALGAVLLPLHIAAAQGQIAGVVRDSGGAGIAGAQIIITGTGLRAESDDAGKFVLARVPAGPAALRVRRLGFAPVSASVVVQSGGTAPLTIIVTEAARGLSPVIVHAQGHRQYTGYLAEFYERRDRGFGHFITGDEIQRRDPIKLTDMLRTFPGINVLPSAIGDGSIRMRGNRCAPLVWLDGMPAAAAEFDLDALIPTSVAGIEIYPGPSTVPPQFVLPFGPTACGTIVVWSRHGERSRGKPISAAELAALVANLQVYTADQVDEPARVDAAAPITPLYPESLYKTRMPGRVVAEFVVDTAGHAEMQTFGVVSSTDPLFTEAVRSALPDARFRPAKVTGRTVPQLVRQPFAFVIQADRTSR